MPRNGSGTYSLPSGNPVVTGTVISSTTQNTTMSDVATALTNSIAKDGQTVPTANIQMGGFKFTGMGPGSAATDSATMGQVQAQAFLQLSTVAGTDTITATSSPATAAYALGQTFRFVAAGANTGATTIDINSIGAKSITKKGTSPLIANDILANAEYQITYDGTQFQIVDPSAARTDDIPVVCGSADATKLARLEVDGLTTGTTRVLTVQDKDGTIAYISDIGIKSITASVNSNNLTATINPATLDFRSTTLGDGTITTVTLASAASVVIPNTATMGTVNAVASRLVLLAINNAGTIEAAIINLAGGNDLSETGLISTTTIGTGSDSNNVAYSTTGRSNVAYRVVGYIESTQATAGVWLTPPSTIQGAGGNAVTAMSSLGYGQTWQTVTRTSGTTYYNTTGKPIILNLVTSAATSGAMNIGGYAFTVFGGGGLTSNESYIIPPNIAYSYTQTGGSFVASELR